MAKGRGPKKSYIADLETEESEKQRRRVKESRLGAVRQRPGRQRAASGVQRHIGSCVTETW